MCVLPSAPRALGLARRHAPFLAHIEDLAASLREARAGREASGKAARAAQDLATLAIHRRQIGDTDGAATALSAAADDLGASLHGRVDGSDEEPTFSTAAQQLIAAETFDAFLRTGTLGARPSSTYTDEEWLGGLIAATHEVGRYAGLAATAGDVRSVEGAAAVVGALHEGLMNFDFRNGSLRRGFDSVKYVERRLEDTLYELKLFPPPPPAAGDASAAEAASAGTAVAPLALVDGAGLDAARAAYATLDAAREEVIKKCREPQKQAKQAIYALQRGDGAAGGRQIEAARKLARLLLAEVKPHPTLRQQAALKGMLEELAEAALFQHWLAIPGGAVLLRGDEAPALLGDELSPSEYLGGVCDLVGEIGRFAVRRAADRDAAAVQDALSTAVAVQAALLSLGHAAPRALQKKAEPLRTAVRKMETLLYELSLVERSGRVRAEPVREEPPPPPQPDE